MTKGFITGSWRYGDPRVNSDLDLVVLVDGATLADLFWHGDDKGRLPGGYGPIRFGKLNVIALTDPEQFEIWKRVTEELEARKPVTRGEAIAALQEAGIE